MITYELLERVAHGNGDERKQALAELAAAAGSPVAYQVVVDTLASTNDDKITFWCLDALIKQFHELLSADGPRLLPLLLSKLLNQHIPTSDRVIWALSIIGPVTVPALLDAIEQAPSTEHRVAYLLALGRNIYARKQAEHVLPLLARLLEDAEESVRFWAMVALVDIGPIQSWLDARLDAYNFETLSAGVLRVAEEFRSNNQNDSARHYYDYITRDWAGSTEKDLH